MKTLKQKLFTFISSEVFKYLFFGVLATVVYIISRTLLFSISASASLSAICANIIAVIFAFFTNDRFVFNQKAQGWSKRFIKFFIARISTLILDLLLAIIFVEQFPNIIGQFVEHNLSLVNQIETVISQILIIIFNYILSKFVIFTQKK